MNLNTENHDNRVYLDDETRSSPAGTSAANKVKVVTRLGKSGERWLTVAFTLRVLLYH